MVLIISSYIFYICSILFLGFVIYYGTKLTKKWNFKFPICASFWLSSFVAFFIYATISFYLTTNETYFWYAYGWFLSIAVLFFYTFGLAFLVFMIKETIFTIKKVYLFIKKKISKKYKNTIK